MELQILKKIKSQNDIELVLNSKWACYHLDIQNIQETCPSNLNAQEKHNIKAYISNISLSNKMTIQLMIDAF